MPSGAGPRDAGPSTDHRGAAAGTEVELHEEEQRRLMALGYMDDAPQPGALEIATGSGCGF